MYFLPSSQATLPERMSKRTYSHELAGLPQVSNHTACQRHSLRSKAVTILLVQYGAQVDLLTTHLYVCGFVVPSKSDSDSRVSKLAELHRHPIIHRGNYVEGACFDPEISTT